MAPGGVPLGYPLPLTLKAFELARDEQTVACAKRAARERHYYQDIPGQWRVKEPEDTKLVHCHSKLKTSRCCGHSM